MLIFADFRGKNQQSATKVPAISISAIGNTLGVYVLIFTACDNSTEHKMKKGRG